MNLVSTPEHTTHSFNGCFPHECALAGFPTLLFASPFVPNMYNPRTSIDFSYYPLDTVTKRFSCMDTLQTIHPSTSTNRSHRKFRFGEAAFSDTSRCKFRSKGEGCKSRKLQVSVKVINCTSAHKRPFR